MLNIGDNQLCLDFNLNIEENLISFNRNSLASIFQVRITEEQAIRITEDGAIIIINSVDI